MSEAPWYAQGLRFDCTRCGNCCTGAPGHTWVSEGEIDALARRIGVDRETFIATYCKRVWRQGRQLVSLIEKKNNDCIFWARGVGCTVYEDRPRQCRTWPFWRPLLADRASWDDAARGCPGMDRGTLHPLDEIQATATDDGLP